MYCITPETSLTQLLVLQNGKVKTVSLHPCKDKTTGQTSTQSVIKTLNAKANRILCWSYHEQLRFAYFNTAWIATCWIVSELANQGEVKLCVAVAWMLSNLSHSPHLGNAQSQLWLLLHSGMLLWLLSSSHHWWDLWRLITSASYGTQRERERGMTWLS